ncbi:hypothetical protein Q5752_004866 [Cryptotrichosporon argae]
MAARIALPRAVVRALLLVLALAGSYLVFTRADGASGAWDTSTSVERARTGRFGGGLSRIRSSFAWSDLAQHADVAPPVARKGAAPRPVLSRLGHENATARGHAGFSRTLVDKQKNEYTLAPLPNLDDALAHLQRRMRDVKKQVPAVPDEHDLANPLFPPFLTPEFEQRYAHLRPERDADGNLVQGGERRYLMVTICRNVAGMLADWFAAWTVLADFVGPESLVFSLMEGDSPDGSGDVLALAMREHLLYLGVLPENIFISTHLPSIDWEAAHRIELLASMRNAVMQPIFASETPHLSPDGHPWSAIVFYNDVYLSATHYLELLHQHYSQDADMTCGWDHAGKWFYDGWVGRDMSGDLFTPFPVREEDQDLPQKLFPSHPPTKARHMHNLPYQVFSCWNGIAVMAPTPFLPPYNVRFRRGTPRRPDQAPGEEECQASESQFIAWDFWKYGFGRVQTVPGVHLTYGKDDARVRGWVELPEPSEEDKLEERIDWSDTPPAKVRCHDWPDRPGKGWWAWDSVRWVDAPRLEVPPNAAGQ